LAGADLLRYAEVVLRLAEVESARHEDQPRGDGRSVHQSTKLMRDAPMLETWPGNHVEHALPDLVKPIRTGPTTSLEQCLELGGRRTEDDH
jgi:hypothetical protein